MPHQELYYFPPWSTPVELKTLFPQSFSTTSLTNYKNPETPNRLLSQHSRFCVLEHFKMQFKYPAALCPVLLFPWENRNALLCNAVKTPTVMHESRVHLLSSSFLSVSVGYNSFLLDVSRIDRFAVGFDIGSIILINLVGHDHHPEEEYRSYKLKSPYCLPALA